MTDLAAEQMRDVKELMKWFNKQMLQQETLGVPSANASMPSTPQELFLPDCTNGGGKILDKSLWKELKNLLASSLKRDSHLKLLYRASRDAWNPTTFHTQCDHQGPTVVLAKSAGKIVSGGNVTTAWSSPEGEVQSPCFFVPPSTWDSKLRAGFSTVNSRFSFPTFGQKAHPDLAFSDDTGHRRASNVLLSHGAAEDWRRSLAESKDVEVTELEVFQLCEESHLTSVETKLLNFQLEPWEMPQAATVAGTSAAVWKTLAQWQRALESKRGPWQLAQERLPSQVRFLRHLAGRGDNGTKEPEIIYLNVRGVRLATLKATLQSYPNSMLATKFGERWAVHDSELVDGGVFFDEDPGLMALVLQTFRLKNFRAEAADEDDRPVVQATKRQGLAKLSKYLAMEEVLSART